MSAPGVIRQDQYGRLTTAHEIARHGEDEVGVGAEHPVQESVGHFLRDVGRRLTTSPAPTRSFGCRSRRWAAPPEPDRVRRHRRDDAIRGPLYEVPDEGSRNAEAEHHELVDAQVIHQTEVVVSIGIPRPVDLERTGRTDPRSCEVRIDAADTSLNASIVLKGLPPRMPAIVEPLTPPPAMSSSGNPEPLSS